MPSSATKLSPLFSILLLLVSMASIQSGASLAKSLFPLVGAAGITTLRLSLGTLILFWIFKPWRMRITAENRRSLLVYGLALGGMNFLFYQSIRTLPLGIAVALEFTGPLAVALFSSRRPVDFLWIGLAIAGMWFLLPTSQQSDSIDLAGAAYALGAGACWAVYIITGQRAGTSLGQGAVALGSLIAALAFSPIGLIQAGSALFSPTLLPLALAVAILSTALPYSLEMVALRRLPAKTFGTLMSLEPAMGALSGIIFLNEYLTLLQWLAMASIIAASVGTTLSIKPRSRLESVKVSPPHE